jgi:hypothetical protein
MIPAKLLKIGLWLAYLAASGWLASRSEGASFHLGGDGWASADSRQPTADSQSVCLVTTADGSAGSGSLVQVEGRLFVLTNFHVVRNDATGRPHGAATVNFTKLGVKSRLTLVATDQDSDVVALDGEPLRGRVPPLWVAADGWREGQAVVYGHPGAGPMRGRLVPYRLGQSLYAIDESGQRVPAVDFQGGAIRGESGGPLVSQRQVVAITWGSNNEGVGKAVPLPRIHNLLRRIFRTQCFGPSCPLPGGRIVIEEPSPGPRQPQGQGPNVWINPQFGQPGQFGQPVQEPQYGDQYGDDGGQYQPPPYQPSGPPPQQYAGEPNDQRGVLLVVAAGVGAALYNLRSRL